MEQSTQIASSADQVNVLLVDDESAFCRQASAYLISDGYRVTAECDARQAISVYETVDPDIVVLDVDLGLQSLDGRMLCSSITKTPRFKEGAVGIILISGHYINSGDELAGLTVGADNYLIKPFKLSQLSNQIFALSRRIKRTLNVEIMTFGELSINLASREVMVNNTAIDLSRLEFNVFCYLAKSSGTVRTKSDLLEHVWGTLHIEESAVAKCVSLIRKKLMLDDPEAYIKTVYGVGYRFVIQE